MDLNLKIIEKVYDDLVSPSAKIIGNNLAKICEKTFNIFPIAKIHLCNCSRKVLEILSNKINNIREENLQIPDTHLFMKSIECLQYRDDKDLITQMFINLITNECDKTKAEKVHPALIEILNKMSKEEAIFLLKEKENMLSNKFGNISMYYTKDNEKEKRSSKQYKILENLSCYGLLCSPLHLGEPFVKATPNGNLCSQFNMTNLLFLLLENIPDNLESEINEK